MQGLHAKFSIRVRLGYIYVGFLHKIRKSKEFSLPETELAPR